jgi:hypothetical protein
MVDADASGSRVDKIGAREGKPVILKNQIDSPQLVFAQLNFGVLAMLRWILK